MLVTAPERGVRQLRAWRKYQILLVFPLLFLVWANLETPFWADDYCRIIPVSFLKPIALAYRDYFEWTGRFFVIATTYYALETGYAWTKIPLDIVNAVIFGALIVNVIGLSRTAAGKAFDATRPMLSSLIDIIFVFLMLWWLPRTIGEVALWKTGSIGYLWPVTGELWVARLLLEDRGLERQPWLIGFGFIIATFLEPVSILMSLLLVAWCIWRWKRQRQPPVWLTCSHCLGTVVLVIAPGNFVRAAKMASGPMLDHVDGVMGSLGSLFDLYWFPFIVVVALAFAKLPMHRKPSPEKIGGDVTAFQMLQANRGWIFILLALAYMALLLGAPRESLAARVSFPASVLLICYIAAIFLRRPVTRRHEWVTGACMLLLFGVHTAITVPDLIQVARLHDVWASDSQFRLGPNANVVLPVFSIKGRTLYVRKDIMFVGFTSDPTYFVNSCYAEVMHVASVVAR
jgi:hypothetical protein